MIGMIGIVLGLLNANLYYMAGDTSMDSAVLNFALVYGPWTLTDVLANWNKTDDFMRSGIFVQTFGMMALGLLGGWYVSNVDYYNVACIGCVVAASVGLPILCIRHFNYAFRTN